MYECHVESGNRVAEISYLTVIIDTYWNCHCQFVRKFFRACKCYERVKPIPSSRALYRAITGTSRGWQYFVTNFVSKSPDDDHKSTDIWFLLNDLSRWSILLLYWRESRPNIVHVSLPTQHFEYMSSHVNSSMTKTIFSCRSFHSPYSIPSYQVKLNLLLTIRN